MLYNESIRIEGETHLFGTPVAGPF